MSGKIITIDWQAIEALPSDVFHYKLLNKQQSAVLLALCEYQYWETRWDNLGVGKHELARFMGDIEYRLMQSEVSMSIDYEAWYDANKRAIYDAANDIAKQIVSGRTFGFSVGDDGAVSDPVTDGDMPLPDDDPATPFDDSLAAKMGGTIAVTRALELLFDKCDTLYGNVNGTPVTLESTAQTLIKAFLPCDGAAMDVAVSTYYTFRATNNRLIFDVTNAMQLYMFCRGGGERAWGQWLSDQSGYAISKFTTMNSLATALSAEFWSGYFEDGAAIPTTQYLDAGCVPIAPQTLTGLVFGTLRNTTPLKSLHRMKFKVKGYALDVDGDIQDAFWYRTAAGVLSRSNWSWVHSAGSNLPSDNQVVYNAAHEYEYTIDLQALNQVMAITPNKNAGMNAVGLTYPVPFEVQLIDLGEYSV